VLRMTFALLAVLTATAAFAAPPPDPDQDALPIEVGRLQVMMSQARDIEQSLGISTAAEDASGHSGSDIFEDLASAVRSYNLLSERACEAKIVDAHFCTSAYHPAWLDGAAPDDAHLRAMTDEASLRLIPFWDANEAR
jgi:hypothetical protein